MTDLPQLRTDLVGAAARRGRRERQHRLLFRVAVLLVVVGVAGAAAAGLGPAPEEKEVPATKRLSDSERLTRAYAVFRRPARKSDRYRGALVVGPREIGGKRKRSRLIARLDGVRYYLVEKGRSLCLVSMVAGRPGGGGCGAIRVYLDGKSPPGAGGSVVVFAFPDGVRSVRLTTDDGREETLPVRDNAIARRTRARPVRMRWTAPDGSPQELEFAPVRPLRPADFYSVLREGDEGATAETGAGRARIFARGRTVCLRLEVAAEALTGCRRRAGDVRRGIIVVLGFGDRRVVAVALGDSVRSVELRAADGTRRSVRVRENTIGPIDAADLESIRYRSPTGETVTDRIPRRSGVRHGYVAR